MTLNPNTQMDQMWGACKVVGADGTSTGATGFREGAVSATARTGAGVYTITLKAGMGVDIQECLPNARLVAASATNEFVGIVQDTDNQFTVSTFAGGVAADRNFIFWVRKVRALNG